MFPLLIHSSLDYLELVYFEELNNQQFGETYFEDLYQFEPHRDEC